MLERLLENWLDSASERSYQSPFCQMLAADGHRVVHSTRHHPIEFGKDVITVAPDGIPCAYQLKGNPGTRLSLAEFRNIQGQLWQLATQAIVFPGIPNKMHRSYLVTNGYVEEDVQKSIAEMNTQFAKAAPPFPCIELISRGTLLEMSMRLGVSLWPSGIDDLSTLIKLLASDGRDQLPLALLHELLLKGMLLQQAESAPSQAEVKRRTTSTALLVATALKEFSRAGNHYAILTGWTLFASYVISACSRYNFDFEETGVPAVSIAVGSIIDSLCALCDEVGSRKFVIEGDPFTDFIAYPWRQNLLRGLLSLLWFWIRTDQNAESVRRRLTIETFLTNTAGKTEIWGEGAVPQALIRIWHLRVSNDAAALNEIAHLLAFIMASNLGMGQQEPLASPYYGYEEVVRHMARDTLTPKDDPLNGESFRSTSYFALPLFYLMAAHGLKGACQAAWPDMTRLNHRDFIPGSAWEYCLWRTDSGMEYTVQLPWTQEWTKVQAEAQSSSCDEVPSALLAQPLLLMLFVILFPYRATPNTIRHLDRCFRT